MNNIVSLQRVIVALVLLCVPVQCNAGNITFETRPDGTTPTDNEELTASYIDGSTIVTFGFDTNSDLNIDVNARFEKRGTDTTTAYSTDTHDDLDKSGASEGGDWMLRNPKDAEQGALSLLNNAFLVKYSGTLAESVSGQIWDIDAGEQYNIEAFNAVNTLLFSILTPVGPGGCCGGPADGLPFNFTFTNLISPVTTIKITQIQGEQVIGFGFDNFSTTVVPEPGSALLFLSGLIVLSFRMRRRIGFRFYSCQ
jgi:hypothetical protein